MEVVQSKITKIVFNLTKVGEKEGPIVGEKDGINVGESVGV